MYLEKMRDRLKEDIARGEADLEFWNGVFPEVRWKTSTDGEDLRDVTEETMKRKIDNLSRDKDLLRKVEEALKNQG